MIENTLVYCAQDIVKSNMIFVNAFAKAINKYIKSSIGNEGSDTGNSFFKNTAVAGLDLFDRITREYGKPEFGIKSSRLQDKEFEVVEEVELNKPFCQLRHFVKVGAPQQKKLLLMAPMAGHNATLLHDAVETMLPHYDLYITDWVNAKEVSLDHGLFDLDDYINYLIEFMTHLSPELSVFAICQPTVPTLAAVSLMSATSKAERLPKNLVLMGGPIDTRKGTTKVDKFAMTMPLTTIASSMISRVPNRYPGAGRRVYPGFMNLTGFMSMNINKHFASHVKFFSDVITSERKNTDLHERFYDEYLATCDMTAEFYLQTVYAVFQEHLLPRHLLHSRGREVNPAAITSVKLLAIEGEKDDITGVGQTKAALDLCSNLPSDKKDYWLQPKVGHYGLFSGHRFRENISPIIRKFIG